MEELMKLFGGYIEYLMQHSDAQHPMWNIEMIHSGKPNKWNYIDGCMLTAILSLYEITGQQRYLDFVDGFAGWFVQEDGQIRTYSPEEYNLDNVSPGRNLFALYSHTGKEKYRRAMEVIRSQLEGQPRTAEGNFWHKKIYPYQVWLDGLYMAQPFYMTYETKFQGMTGCLDSFAQFENVFRLMRDEKTGLYYHGYDESRQMEWANPQTGLSRNFWLRALGWFLLALVDTAEGLSEQLYYEYRTLQARLRELVDAMLPYQHPEGMFYQVIDRPEAPGNYLETSGTALFAYGVLKAVRLGFLPEKYSACAVKAFEGTCKRYLKQSGGGIPSLGGICLVAGLGGPNHRDGSLGYYFSEPVVENEAKGVAPMLLAYTELLRRGAAGGAVRG